MFTETCTGFPIHDAFKLENHKDRVECKNKVQLNG